MLLLAVLVLVNAVLSNPLPENGKNYAVLVAGSNTWSNYRHQADICHAFQILTQIGGIPPEQITVMMADDIANNENNPMAPKIINYPGGPDVYAGVNKDYTGKDVTAKNFMKVLESLPSTSQDNIFVYFSDHGAAGLVAMPFGPPLTADQLMNTIQTMHKAKKFNQLVIYVEACESGSMFDGLLPKDINVYATSASDDNHSSFAWFFDKDLGVYIADQYSIMWMQDSQYNMTSGETLESQWKTTKAETTESTVMQFGDLTIAQEKVEKFQAEGVFSTSKRGRSGEFMAYVNNINMNGRYREERPGHYAMRRQKLGEDEKLFTTPVNNRDIKLETLRMRLYVAEREAPMSVVQELREEIKRELDFRQLNDERFQLITTSITSVVNQYPELQSDLKFWMSKRTVLKTEEEWQCLKDAYAHYEKNCDKFEDYSLKYVRVLYNLCSEILLDSSLAVKRGISVVCGSNKYERISEL